MFGTHRIVRFFVPDYLPAHEVGVYHPQDCIKRTKHTDEACRGLYRTRYFELTFDQPSVKKIEKIVYR